VLIAAGSWRLIFVLNAPLVLVTVTLIARGVPGGASAGTGGRLDFLGAFFAALALSGSVFAVTEEPARGWISLVIGSLAVGILGAIAFIAHEARARAPMLPLRLFRERNFTIGNVATLTAYLGLGGCDLSAACVSAGGQRLQPRSGRTCASAGHLADDRVLSPVRLTRRPHRLKGADQPRGAGRRGRPLALGACGSAR
jgi:hypothetical protein